MVLAKILVPTRDQFSRLVAAMRNCERTSVSQGKGRDAADLVELLAYSGMRLGEATAVRWADIDFTANSLIVTGGDKGTKNHKTRVIPMTEALVRFLQRLKAERNPHLNDRVSRIDSAKKCLQTTCRKLELPQFTHHDFRHFFATTCIEAGVDIPTISRWLGHKDGGALAMRVYGHLRQEHSFAMIKRVQFGAQADL